MNSSPPLLTLPDQMGLDRHPWPLTLTPYLLSFSLENHGYASETWNLLILLETYSYILSNVIHDHINNYRLTCPFSKGRKRRHILLIPCGNFNSLHAQFFNVHVVMESCQTAKWSCSQTSWGSDALVKGTSVVLGICAGTSPTTRRFYILGPIRT